MHLGTEMGGCQMGGLLPIILYKLTIIYNQKMSVIEIWLVLIKSYSSRVGFGEYGVQVHSPFGSAGSL